MCLPIRLRKTWFSIIIFKSQKLTFVLCFSSTPVSSRFFQLSSTYPVHLKIGTCSFNIMLNNNFMSLTPCDSENPYNPNWETETGSLSKLKEKENSNYQHYKILIVYEVQDETSTSSTYVSLVFYRTVRYKKLLVKK
jgi:hypothetical protein